MSVVMLKKLYSRSGSGTHIQLAVLFPHDL
jgi:hypothetical protein